MRKYMQVICGLTIVLIFGREIFAQDINIELRPPKKSSARFSGMPEIAKPVEVSGVIAIDIHPYPDLDQAGECLVEYFLNSEPVFSTQGELVPGSEVKSFKCKLDTTQKNNGNYAIYVNYWDKNGNSAIGSQKIIIKNRVEE